MKLFLVSDIHGDGAFFSLAEEEMKKADLVVIAGDLTTRGSAKEAENILKSIERVTENIAAVHGNWDPPEVIALLEERGYSLHGRGKVIEEHGFFGVGGSSPTPMNTPTEYQEDELASILSAGYEKVSHCDRIIMVSHTPPRKTRDRTFLGIRGGSQSVRSMIENQKVDLCLCGHIHEAAGSEKLAECLVANPGSFKKGKYMTIDLGEEARVTRGRLKK